MKYCVAPIVSGFKMYFDDIVTATVCAYKSAYEGCPVKIVDYNGFIIGTFKVNADFNNPKTVIVKMREYNH